MSNLVSLVAGAWLAAVCGAGAEPPNSFEVMAVAPGVYAFVSPGTTSGVVNGNSVAIEGDDSVLVVDSGQFPLATRRMIDEIRRRTDKPVRFLVNTHWHADHVLANHEYQRAYPGVVIVAHTETRRLMLKNKERVLQLPTEGKGFLEALQAALRRGARRDGTPFTEEDLCHLGGQVRDLEAVQAELRETRLLPADATFTEAATIHLGRREVRLLHLGRANTAGDLVVWVPDAQVVVTGDILVSPVPFGYGSYPGEWQQVLEKLVALNASEIVPGHGQVMRDTRYLRSLQKLLGALRTQSQAAVKQGLTLEQARTRLDLGDVRRELTHGDPLLDRAFDAFFLDSAFGQAFNEARGEPLVE